MFAAAVVGGSSSGCCCNNGGGNGSGSYLRDHPPTQWRPWNFSGHSFCQGEEFHLDRHDEEWSG